MTTSTQEESAERMAPYLEAMRAGDAAAAGLCAR